MTIRRSALFIAFLLCWMSSLASANSVSIAVTGTGWQGQPGFNCCFNGDFSITGPGLSLFQSSPDGPTSIGTCVAGTVCNFSYQIGSSATFCTYCTGFSGGSLGGKTADFLDSSLTFNGSAFYSGDSTMTVPMTVTGSIIGYKLVNC